MRKDRQLRSADLPARLGRPSRSRLALAAFALAALTAFALAACGPSGKQVNSARQARYQGDRSQIFAVVKQTVAARYKIEKADEAAFGIQTEGRWHNPEGQVMSANIGDLQDVPDQALHISLIVEILPDGDKHIVSVKPHIQRYTKGKSAPDPVEQSDPSLPGWVQGKGDNLQVELYEALKEFEVKVTGGAAPAPAPAPAPAAPAPAPAAPSPDPAAGSAAPPPTPAP
jgi:hypothetical protein